MMVDKILKIYTYKDKKITLLKGTNEIKIVIK